MSRPVDKEREREKRGNYIIKECKTAQAKTAKCFFFI
jgi:predicted RNA-binding protein YlxR (DUF448 family)